MSASKHMGIALALVVPLIATGCTTTSQISSAQPGAVIAIKGHGRNEAPVQDRYKTTSFGNYEFRADAEGHEPMYGILPLKFNGGYLAADILFFAPLAFFNLREPYPYYEIDVAEGVIRFRRNENDAWREYRPSGSEVQRARLHFGDEAK